MKLGPKVHRSSEPRGVRRDNCPVPNEVDEAARVQPECEVVRQPGRYGGGQDFAGAGVPCCRRVVPSNCAVVPFASLRVETEFDAVKYLFHPSKYDYSKMDDSAFDVAIGVWKRGGNRVTPVRGKA